MNSTYNIRVGRSTNITGPYLDRNGVNMVSGGGTLFLKTTGKFIGPGQMGILEGDGIEYFGYHYYDGNNNGAPTYDLEPLSWTADGWPAFTNDWSALYHFHMDASDDNGQYYGLMNNGANAYYDPLLGNVLSLNGTNQFVSLPGGAANACSFITVFQWNGGLPWQRVFDFGRSTNSYAFLTPQNAAGVMRFTITSSGIGGEQHLDAPSAAPIGDLDTGGGDHRRFARHYVCERNTRGYQCFNDAHRARHRAHQRLVWPEPVSCRSLFQRSNSVLSAFTAGHWRRRKLSRRNRASPRRRRRCISSPAV